MWCKEYHFTANLYSAHNLYMQFVFVGRSHYFLWRENTCGWSNQQVSIWAPFQYKDCLSRHRWVGVEGFSLVVATFNHVGESFNLFMANTGGVWIIPSFLIWGYVLSVEHIFMCHHELWPTSVGHPFSFLNSSWGLTGGKHYQKITIAIFRFVLQNFIIPGYFPYILFYSCLFSLLSSGWFVIAVCGSISVQGTS